MLSHMAAQASQLWEAARRLRIARVGRIKTLRRLGGQQTRRP